MAQGDGDYEYESFIANITNFPLHNPLQSPEVSSSSDLYTSPFRSRFAVAGRPSYRLRRPMASAREHSEPALSTRLATASVLLIFGSSIFTLLMVYKTFPTVTEDEREHVKLPWNIEDAKNLGVVLNRYKGDHYLHVMSGVFLTYIFLQTFAIPGSLFLSIMSGFLFPFGVALVLVCTCSALGASLCFMLSQLLGRRLILRFWPQKARAWAAQVDRHRANLFNYILFLRITPFLPNWFINLTAPVIGVPLAPFALGTFLGVAPPSFLAIQTGQTLQSLTADDFAQVGYGSFLWLGLAGCVPLLPIVFKGWFKKKLE